MQVNLICVNKLSTQIWSDCYICASVNFGPEFVKKYAPILYANINDNLYYNIYIPKLHKTATSVASYIYRLVSVIFSIVLNTSVYK